MPIITSHDWTLCKHWILDNRSPIHTANRWTARNWDGADIFIVKGYYYFDGRLVDFIYNEADSTLVLLFSERKKTFRLSQLADLQLRRVLGLID